MNVKQKPRVCPICGQEYWEFPAISRKDNKTEICPECGFNEALKSFVEGAKRKNSLK